MNPLGLIRSIAELGAKIMDHWFPASMSEADREKAKQEFVSLFQAAALQDQEIRASIVRLEAQGSWLQRNWRPLLMIMIMGIVLNNYVLLPYLRLFGLPAVELQLPNQLWNLLTVGVGGYVVGRSAEKVMEKWRQ